MTPAIVFGWLLERRRDTAKEGALSSIRDLIVALKAELKFAKTFRWRPQGPVMRFFREEAVGDYHSGGFDGEGELPIVVRGRIGRSLATGFVERPRRVGQDFAAQHLADQRLPAEHKRPLYAGDRHAQVAVRRLPPPEARRDDAALMDRTAYQADGSLRWITCRPSRSET